MFTIMFIFPDMASYLFAALRMTERKFNIAYNQVALLDKKIEDMKRRCELSKTPEQKKYCYNIRLQISVLEGTRNMYYEYVQRMAFTLDALQKNSGLIDVDMPEQSDCISDDCSDEEEEDGAMFYEDNIKEEPETYSSDYSYNSTQHTEAVIEDGIVFENTEVIADMTEVPSDCHSTTLYTEQSTTDLYCNEQLTYPVQMDYGNVVN